MMGVHDASGNVTIEVVDDRDTNFLQFFALQVFHHKLLYVLYTLIVGPSEAHEFNGK
jgi:hypothetical protein